MTVDMAVSALTVCNLVRHLSCYRSGQLGLQLQ